jgi:hypothetical protein
MAGLEPVSNGDIQGAGIDPSHSVFINCPFDDDYRPLMYAIVFSVVCCGFLPRSALETGDTAKPRMVRIWEAMSSSKYSIHDLSRCRGEGSEQLARFNMPLELGMAMSRRFVASSLDKNRHDWLVLVPEGHVYGKFVSDLAGYDPETHKSTVETVIPPVVAWLSTRKEAASSVNPRMVLDKLNAFNAETTVLEYNWVNVNKVPWSQLVIAARNTVPSVIGGPGL